MLDGPRVQRTQWHAGSKRDVEFEEQVVEKYRQQRLTSSVSSPYTCSGNHDNLNQFHMRGTALGGWLVLEPWLTPSLFYQFLDASTKWGDDAPNHIGLDSYTFCTALGKEEANKQLRRHWQAWVKEEHIQYLAQNGVDTIRIPVGDWMYVPYEPYIGCMDGAMDELNRILQLCLKYDIKALIDVHAMKGSQNGLDNSGNTERLKWVSTLSSGGEAVYEHWNIRGGDWIGSYNSTTHQYDNINTTNIEHSLNVIRKLVDVHKSDPVVIGVEPVNEPWWPTPIDTLKQFYWDSYQIIQSVRPDWITLLHDSFRLVPGIWGDFMINCPNYAIDSHLYQAWAWEMPPEWFEEHACYDGEMVRIMESIGVPVIVGEWSLATDNCAMWLNGLNDNVPGYPKVKCERIVCPPPYMGYDQPGTLLDPTKGAQDPFGTGGESYVEYGTCPRDKPFDNDDFVMTTLGYSKLNAFDLGTHGQFFWNFRTEFEPRWDYMEATKKGWIPSKYEKENIADIAAFCSWSNPTSAPTLPVEAAVAHNTSSANKDIINSFLIFISVSTIIGAIIFIRKRRREPINSYKYVTIPNIKPVAINTVESERYQI